MRGVQAAQVLLRGQHRRMAEQVTQHHQRISLGQVQRQRGIRASVGNKPGGLPVVTADQLFEGPNRQSVAEPVGVDTREPRLRRAADPVCGAFEHGGPGRERTSAPAHRDQARAPTRRDQTPPLARRQRVPRPADPVDPPAPGIGVCDQQRLTPAAGTAIVSRPWPRPGPAPGSDGLPPEPHS